jgi:maleylacetate reductase
LTTPLQSGWSQPSPAQTVAFGIPIAEALPEAVRRLSGRRVAVIAANSLSQPGGPAETICGILGDRFHTLLSGIKAHTPRADVARVVKAFDGADAVVSLGGGSVCDSVKAARLCLANGISDAAGMDRLRSYDKAGEPGSDPTKSPTLPFIAIPTTLSAAEFSAGAGITDERGPHKQVYIYPGLAPNIVILDPEMTRSTPPRLWFGSGLRAVDHAVETWCSINPTPLSNAYSLYAARLLVNGLRAMYDSPDNLQARLDCMTGSWLSILGPSAGGVKCGGSHGMGHALGGTAGMPHGETSCVMLPHILRYNASVNGDRQAQLAATIGQPQTPLAEIIAELVVHLQLPSSLRAAGVSESVLGAVADAALHDPLLRSNPRPITELPDILKLLRQAW